MPVRRCCLIFSPSSAYILVNESLTSHYQPIQDYCVSIAPLFTRTNVTMKFIQPTIILSLISSAIAYTTMSQVIDDVISLNSAVVDLTAAVAAYQGGLFTAISPAISFVVVEARLTKGVTDTRLLPPSTLSESDTQDLIDTVASTLAINNPKAVAGLKAKKALIDASYQTSIVKIALQTLLSGHLQFEEQIVQRSPASKVAGVQAVADIITVALQDGINTFST